jgi:DNA-binding transcriptional LysR family regulator
MELRDLKAFVLLGEELHFRRTAERLNLTQSALSKQVQRLEEALGGPLFDRGPGSTRLSPLGRSTYAEAKALVEGAEHLERRARLAVEGVLGTLRLGFGITTKAIAIRAIARFRAARPEIMVELHEISARHQIAAMSEGRLDAGFCRLPAPQGWPWLPVAQEHLIAVLPAGFPPDTPLEALAGHPLVMIDRHRSPAFHDHAMGFLARCGLRPSRQQAVTEFPTAVALVEAGVGWAMVPSTTPVPAGLPVLPFQDPSACWEVGLVRPPGDAGVIPEAFWQVVAEQRRTEPSGPPGPGSSA